MPREDVAAYLRRLGVEAEPPSVDGLRRLHRAHVERVPYETFWIHLDQAWGIEPEASLRRIARDGRGGYCFQLNGSLSLLLDALGYRVTRHVGGVHGPDGPSVEALTNHLVLVVHGLPDEDSPDGRWYVDAGLGDALHEPLPLVPGTYQQGPLRFELRATDDGVGDWHLTHDPVGSFPGMSFRAEPTGMDAFADATSGCRPRRSPASCGWRRPRPATPRVSTSCAVVCSRSSAAAIDPAPTTFERRGRLVRRPRGPARAAARRRRRHARAPVGQGRGRARAPDSPGPG